MPTTKKRVNLSVPDVLYERIQRYKEKNGITSDASACLQLITRQLDGIDNTEKLLRVASGYSLDELQQLSNAGIGALKIMADHANSDNK